MSFLKKPIEEKNNKKYLTSFGLERNYVFSGAVPSLFFYCPPTFKRNIGTHYIEHGRIYLNLSEELKKSGTKL